MVLVRGLGATWVVVGGSEPFGLCPRARSFRQELRVTRGRRASLSPSFGLAGRGLHYESLPRLWLLETVDFMTVSYEVRSNSSSGNTMCGFVSLSVCLFACVFVSLLFFD